MVQKVWYSAKGPRATRLRRRKYEIVRQYDFPEDALPGSISRTFRRCGKDTCHCAKDEGHPIWILSFSLDGKKHTETLPKEWVDKLEPLVEKGSELRDALSELLRINAQLFHLWRQEKREKSNRSKSKNKKYNSGQRSALKRR